MTYTTVAEYRNSHDDCTGDFIGQDGSTLTADDKITISADGQEWCAGHDPANATFEDLY